VSAAERQRTIHWHDPREALAAAAAHGYSGLEFLRAMAAGEIPRPPFGELLDFTLEEIDPGRVVFGLQTAEFHYNPNGVMHGGVAAALLDTVTGCAVTTRLPHGVTCATLELKVNYIRSLTAASPRLRCIGTVIHLGRRSALAEGRLLLPDEKLAAFATATLMVFPPEDPHQGKRGGGGRTAQPTGAQGVGS
jgi:uncharacterized protein (TIGR00369 family)